ncbi:hypothetical protein Tco_0746703 [Tanacetum coccineum]
MNKNFLRMSKSNQQVNVVNPSCETCGGPHHYSKFQAGGGFTQGDVYAATGNHNTGDGLSLIATQVGKLFMLDSYTSSMCEDAWGRISFDRALMEINADSELKHEVSMAIPLEDGSGHTREMECRSRNTQEDDHVTGPEMTQWNEDQESDNEVDEFIFPEGKKFGDKFDIRLKGRGALPSNTVPNPREDIKVITTRSGITLPGPSVLSPNPSSSSSKEVERDPETTMDQPPIPYPSRLNKEKLQDKYDIQITKFLEIFKKLHFNISLVDALAQMPKYAKMLKGLLTNKEKLLELANTPLNENRSVVPFNKLPEKLEDPG